MSSGATVTATTTTTTSSLFRTILEKPLNQLTEDDISQLTREDCRKYLKEKGMRRPSWNKSQAIQQVISLKALLEPNEDSGAGFLRKIVASPHNHHHAGPRAASNSADSAREASVGGDVRGSADAAEEAVGQYHKNEPQKPVQQDRPFDAASNAVSPRNQCATDASVRQMTIFYCGKVNVYDEVPPEKARTIMHFAAKPNHLPPDNQYSGTAPARPMRCQFHVASDKDGPFSPNAAIPQAMQTEKIADYTQLYWDKGNSTRDPEGQASRKVSLQRYREKRKDRERVKIKKNMGSSSCLEAYLNHQLRRHASNGNSSRSSTSSPPQHPGMLQAADHQPKIRRLPVDLNKSDILEC